MNEPITQEDKPHEEIVYDFRYTFISKDEKLLFVITMPYFIAVLPFIFSFILIFLDFPWPVKVFIELVIWAFICFCCSKKIIIIDRSNKLILEIVKIFSFKYSKKKYPFHSKVFFLFEEIEYDEGGGVGHNIFLRINYKSIWLLDCSDKQLVFKTKDILEKDNYLVKMKPLKP